MGETGFLLVFVTEANGTLPVEGAFVTVSEYEPGTEGDVIRILRTGEDGLTGAVGLPAPPAADSTEPGEGGAGALYNVTVRAAGYYTVEAVGVPVFSGIVSRQSVDLQPIGASVGEFAPGQVVLYETPGVESLEAGGLRREDIGGRNGIVSGGVRGSVFSADGEGGSL